MSSQLLICTDLDRTLLPNGAQPESPAARRLFRDIVSRNDVQLAYVTGRHRELVEQAIAEYQLPGPDFVIGDVGTSIYTVDDKCWRLWTNWHDTLASSWGQLDGPGMLKLLAAIKELTPQEQEKQGRFKCSFYTPVVLELNILLQQIKNTLDAEKLTARTVWSIDDNRQLGLLDILPERASKLLAIRFLMQHTGFDSRTTLFAGDSGNDLEVLGSDIPAVLVANASDSIRKQARELCRTAGTEQAFYAAQGGHLGMNGNYSAGILEGLAHFFPHSLTWMPPEEPA